MKRSGYKQACKENAHTSLMIIVLMEPTRSVCTINPQITTHNPGIRVYMFHSSLAVSTVKEHLLLTKLCPNLLVTAVTIDSNRST